MAKKVIVIDPSAETLPFQDALEWDSFQNLCVDVLSRQKKVKDCRDYLEKGNKQDGIDVYAIKDGTEKFTVAQCKLKKYIPPKEVIRIVEDFLKGSFADKSDEFILCTSFNLSRQIDEEETIDGCRNLLKEKDISFIVWDEKGLSKEFRNAEYYDIVLRYFGKDVLIAFYSEKGAAYLNCSKTVNKVKYNLDGFHIPRTIRDFRKAEDEKTKWIFNRQEDNETLIELFDVPPIQLGKKLLLLSIAGYGKSKELENLAAYYSTEDKLIIPIKFVFRDYENEKIEDLLNGFSLDWKSIPDENLLLIFDGLDERNEKSEKFINVLNQFIENHPNCNVVVSARYNTYDAISNPLRGFQVYTLNALSEKEVDTYLKKRLQSDEEDFNTKIENSKFLEYRNHPYYLTRLVRFYLENNKTLPNTKSEMIETILVEQIKEEEKQTRQKNIADKFLPIAKKIAFCMTVSNKVSITESEFEKIVLDEKDRNDIKRFRLLNNRGKETELWEFEHKNIQEYLTAKVLSELNFEKIIQLIITPYNKEKLNYQFLNTLGFLFEMFDNTSTDFSKLLEWLTKYEPEVIIRLEKEQIDIEIRNKIFLEILNGYKETRFSMYASQHFRIEELANFAEFNDALLHYLINEISTSTKEDFTIDCLEILIHINTPYRFEDKITKLLFELLNSKQTENLKQYCIRAFLKCNFIDKKYFERIITSKIDCFEKNINYNLISILSKANNYSEEYVDFILDSALNYTKNKNSDRIYFGSSDILKDLITGLNSPIAIKKTIKFFANNITIINNHNSYDFSFDKDEMGIILGKAATIYNNDRTISIDVYRLLLKLEIHHSIFDQSYTAYKEFFKNTCGLFEFFKRVYENRKDYYSLVHFADEECCKFLIAEYAEGKITEDTMMVFSSNLKYIDKDLTDCFIEEIDKITPDKFRLENRIDFIKLKNDYDVKNQEMILDKKFYLKEIEDIYSAIGKNEATEDDLSDHRSKNVDRFRYSTAKQMLFNKSWKLKPQPVIKEDVIKQFSDDCFWISYSIEKGKQLIESKQYKDKILPQLRKYLEDWCTGKIKELDFTNSIEDLSENSFRYTNGSIAFVKSLFESLDFELSDDLLIKMLPADYSGMYGEVQNKSSLYKLIINKVKDKEALKKAVLNNINNGNLARPVLFTHYSICNKLGLKKESLSLVFKEIVSNRLFLKRDKINLTKIYLELGGKIVDFEGYLKIIGNKNEDTFNSWEWYLIEEFNKKNKTESILESIITDNTFSELIRTETAKLLLQNGNIEGLKFWEEQIYEGKSFSYSFERRELQNTITKLPSKSAIQILASTLFNLYERNDNTLLEFPHDLQQIIFECFNLIVLDKNDLDIFNFLIRKLNEVGELENISSSQNDSLNFLKQRITQNFYLNHDKQLSIENSVYEYDKITA